MKQSAVGVARAVENDIDPAESVEGRSNDPAGLFCRRGDHGDGSAAGRVDLLAHRMGGLFDVVDDDFPPARPELPGRRPADRTAAASDNDDLVVEPHGPAIHDVPLAARFSRILQPPAVSAICSGRLASLVYLPVRRATVESISARGNP